MVHFTFGGIRDECMAKTALRPKKQRQAVAVEHPMGLHPTATLLDWPEISMCLM